MEIPSINFDTTQADFLRVVEDVLGPQFDEAGKQAWWCIESDDEVGFRVSDGKDNYFYSVGQDNYAGVKRISYQKNGSFDQVSIYPFRSLEEDHPNNRAVNWY